MGKNESKASERLVEPILSSKAKQHRSMAQTRLSLWGLSLHFIFRGQASLSQQVYGAHYQTQENNFSNSRIEWNQTYLGYWICLGCHPFMFLRSTTFLYSVLKETLNCIDSWIYNLGGICAGDQIQAGLSIH